jgi:uncharacterized protein YecE (DUF72 family)
MKPDRRSIVPPEVRFGQTAGGFRAGPDRGRTGGLRRDQWPRSATSSVAQIRDDSLGGFPSAAQLLGDKLLCCCLQFGYFNKKAFASLDAFLERLDPFLAAWPDDVPVAAEIRNKNWMTAEFADCLRSHRAAWVLSDQAWMPSPLYVPQKLDAATGPFGYIRLLGDRNEVDRLTKTLDHIVIDRQDQIHADAEAIKLLAKRVPVLAFVNNHFAGYAPETLGQLAEALI